MAYYGTNSLFDVEKACEANDEKALLYYEGNGLPGGKGNRSMCCCTVRRCTGDSSHRRSSEISDTGRLDNQEVKFISQVLVFPGEDEMEELCQGALRVFAGEDIAKHIAQRGGV